MIKDIEILQDFIAYDKSRLDELYPDLPYTLNKINEDLREKAKSFYVVYRCRSSNNPIFELIELLDGNNFIIIDDPVHQMAKLIPLYPEGSE